MLDMNVSQHALEGDDTRASSELEKAAVATHAQKYDKKGLNTSIAKPVQASYEEQVLTLVQPAKCTLQRKSLKDYPEAVCNDGTPASYLIKLGTLPEDAKLKAKYSSIWLVYLQGGGWCYDESSCEERCGKEHDGWKKYMCTSKYDKDMLEMSGIFVDPALENANKVYVRYCTSDAHMGDASFMRWQFRGKLVVQAVMTDLVVNHGLGGGLGRELLIFGGESSGSRGAMVHIDYLPEMLGDDVAPNVDIVGFFDSPAWIDLPHFSKDKKSLHDITKTVLENAEVDHIGETCKDKYPDELWKCIFGEYRLPTLKTSFFLMASQYDSAFLGFNGIKEVDTDEKHAFVMNYAKRTRDLMDTVVNMENSRNVVFSWACYSHMLARTSEGFFQMTCDPDGTTMSSAFQQFLGVMNLTTGPKLKWIDSCRTLNCGSGCSPSQTQLVKAQSFQTQWFQATWFMASFVGVEFFCCLVMILVCSWRFIRW